MRERILLVYPLPKERISLFIGKHGKNKKLLEKILGTKIRIDDERGIIEVRIYPEEEIAVKDMFDAILSGISIDDASKLLEENYVLYKINMRDIYGKKRKTINRYKGRVIGLKGIIKKRIEEYTSTKISVYDDYIYIVGKLEDVMTAKEAVEMILRGSKHSTIITFLEKKVLEKNLMLR